MVLTIIFLGLVMVVSYTLVLLFKGGIQFLLLGTFALIGFVGAIMTTCGYTIKIYIGG